MYIFFFTLGTAVSVGPPLSPDWNISTTVGWIATKFGANIHDPLRMKCNNFTDPLTFHLSISMLTYQTKMVNMINIVSDKH